MAGDPGRMVAGTRMTRPPDIPNPETLEAIWAQGRGRLLPVCEDRVFLHWPAGEPRALAPARREAGELLEHSDLPVWVASHGDRHYFAVRVTRFRPRRRIPGGDFGELREIAGLLGDRDWSLLARAKAMIHWHEQHGFCGRCGTPTEREPAGLSRRCPNPACGARHFPRTDPAVIMRITHGDRLLLARQPQWPVERRSVLAGFVAPGETAEETIRREVFEEAGLRVDPASIRYFGSQPWPFPGSLMMAYTARSEDDTIRRLDGELAEAEWWSRPALRAALDAGRIRPPGRHSIARRLVEDWLDPADSV